MIALVLVELEKLRTVRSTWTLFAAGTLLPLPIAIAALIVAGDLARMPQDVANLVAVPAIFSASLAAIACAREFEHRTIAVSFMLEPRRERVIAAKALAAAALGVAMTLLFLALCFGLTAVWLSYSGVAWPWSGSQTVRGIGGALAFAAAMTVAGTGFAGVVRHVGAAITALLGVLIALDAILGALFAVWNDYGLGEITATLLEPASPHTYGFATALLLLAAITAAALAAGIAVVRRADV